MTKPKPMNEWQAVNLPDSLPLHFRRNVEPGDNGCWLWVRSCSPDGYGWASFRNRTYQAHRLAYSLVVGEIPDGMQLDHLCRVRRCIRPDHLEPVLPSENLERSPYTPAGMGRCVMGHEFSRYYGQRRCLVCKAAYAKARARGAKWESRRPCAGRTA